MRVLCVDSPGVSFQSYVTALRAGGVRAELVPDDTAALWMLAGGSYRVVLLDLESGPAAWDVVSAALWQRPPARVVAVAGAHTLASLRRKAYEAGVYELAERPRRGQTRPAASLLASVRSALDKEARPAILFVDDAPEVVEGLGGLIRQEGYRVEGAATAADAARLMGSRRYALIITEVRKAGPDGYQVMREAALRQPGVPVVVLTAALDDAAFLRSVELGAGACLWKLAEPEEILRALREALAAGTAHGPSRIEE
ncbi:MAG TPA: response regulator [Candidatus Polarisedimenticolia bacterium]|nr:response regulator [Candidatus Polarisedimenticolia bacterium]